MTESRKARVKVLTLSATYVGDFVIPEMRNRVSDVLNDDQRIFINLTDVLIDDIERADIVSLNKNLIESITQL